MDTDKQKANIERYDGTHVGHPWEALNITVPNNNADIQPLPSGSIRVGINHPTDELLEALTCACDEELERRKCARLANGTATEHAEAAS